MGKSHLTCFCGMLSPWGCLALSHLTRLLLPLNVAFPASFPLLLLMGRGGGGRQIKYSGTISVKSVRIKNILHFFALAFALFVRLLLLPLLLHLLASFSVSVKCATTVGRSSGLGRGMEGGRGDEFLQTVATLFLSTVNFAFFALCSQHTQQLCH